MTKDQLISVVEESLNKLPGNNIEISQPIQLRMDDLIAGAKGDVAIKIFGDDLEILRKYGGKISSIIKRINGSSDVRMEEIIKLPFIDVNLKRHEIGRLGLNATDILHNCADGN